MTNLRKEMEQERETSSRARFAFESQIAELRAEVEGMVRERAVWGEWVFKLEMDATERETHATEQRERFERLQAEWEGREAEVQQLGEMRGASETAREVAVAELAEVSKELRRWREERAQEVEETKRVVEEKHAEVVTELKEKHREEMKAVHVEHMKAMAKLVDEHEKAMVKLGEEHESAVTDLQTMHDVRLEEVRTKHVQAVEELEGQYQRTVATREAKHEQTVADQGAKHKQTVTELEGMHCAAVKVLESRLETQAEEQVRLTAALRAAEQSEADLRSAHAAEMAQYKQQEETRRLPAVATESNREKPGRDLEQDLATV